MPSCKISRHPCPLENHPGGAGLFFSWVRSGRAVRLLEWVLWALALAAASTLTWVALDRVVHQRQQARQLRQLAPAARHLPVALPAAPIAARPALADGELVGYLEIPAAGIAEFVASGIDPLTLRRGVGHVPGTALPGEPGNVGLAGHRDTVFRGLREVELGDPIRLVTAAGAFEYRVESLQTVTPDRGDVLAPSAAPTLTLVTCFPFDFVGRAPLRFIVRARQVEPGQGNLACRPCSAATQALHADLERHP